MKLAVFDVDGTLLIKRERRIPMSCIHALQELKQQGIQLAIASGRPPFAMDPYLLKHVDFDYFICSNGAYVQNAKKEALYQFCFSETETADMIRFFRERDIALMFQCHDAAYCYHGYKRISNMLEGFLGRLAIIKDMRMEQNYIQERLPMAAVAKIEDQDIDSMRQHFSQFQFTPFDHTFYDINGFHNKATGIRHICEALDWDMKDVIAFGDDYNDLEMIRECGLGVAMGDAKEKVKAQADYVTDLCSQDGIAKALKHYGLIQEVQTE